MSLSDCIECWDTPCTCNAAIAVPENKFHRIGSEDHMSTQCNCCLRLEERLQLVAEELEVHVIDGNSIHPNIAAAIVVNIRKFLERMDTEEEYDCPDAGIIRRRELEEYVLELKQAQSKVGDKVEFRLMIAQAHGSLGLSDQIMAETFECSISTIARWRSGLSAPHAILQNKIYEWLIGLAEKQLQQGEPTQLPPSERTVATFDENGDFSKLVTKPGTSWRLAKTKTGEVVAQCKALVLQFFEGDTYTADLWFKLPNALFGGISPNNMIELRKTHMLLKVIQNQLAENKPTSLGPT